MSIRTIAVVFLALLSGAGMSLGVLQANRPTRVEVAEVTETEPVLVAVAKIDRGAMLSEADVEIRQWPKGLSPAGALRTVDEATERGAVGVVMAGEVILDSKLSPKDSGRGLASLITPGMRAFTVQASRVATNVAGFILPGNKVDVLLNMKGGRGDDTGGGSTTTLLQAIEVLAVDQRLEAPADNKVDPKGLSSVTLLVTPEQANLLDLGQNMGVLTFSLRNLTDTADANPAPTTVNDIRFRGEAPSDVLDGDQPPSAELLAKLQTLTGGSRPPASQRDAAIVTFRGSQRGRVTLTDGLR